MRIIVLELVALALLAAVALSPVAAVAVVVVAAPLLAVTFGRLQGHWWLERRALVRGYRRRRRQRPLPKADPRLSALQLLAPNLAVQTVRAADGSQVGVGRDDAGWFAVAAILPATPMSDEPGAHLPLDRLVSVLTEVAQPGAILQVVRQTVAAPGLAIDPDSPVGQSYRQLLASTGPLPLDQTTWVAVRLDGRRLAEAGAIGNTDVDAAPLVVAALVRRLGKSLRHAGIQCQVLDAQALTAALAASCDLEPGPEGEPSPSREDWTGWHSRLFAHRSFWVREWPPVTQAAALFDLFNSVAPMTAVALTLAPDDDIVDLQCLVRVAAPAAMLPQVCTRLIRRAPKVGARLQPLDGEQGPATYATAPTGGGSR